MSSNSLNEVMRMVNSTFLPGNLQKIWKIGPFCCFNFYKNTRRDLKKKPNVLLVFYLRNTKNLRSASFAEGVVGTIGDVY